MIILWPLKRENTLRKQPPNAVPQICVWQLLLRSFKNVTEGVKLNEKMNALLVTFQGSSYQL